MKKKENNPRKADITTIGEAIESLFNSYKMKGKFDENKLINSWEEIMGKPIASRTSKIFIKNSVLFVELSSAPLKHELNMSKQKILDLFEKELGHKIVNEIIFM